MAETTSETINRVGIDIEFPKTTGTLKINESLIVDLYKKLPNRFHRWMARMLLGWEYKEKKEDG